MQNFRIGYGEDHHQLVTKNGKKLVFGGLEIESDLSPLGNSDADVILHALCNALSTAIGGYSFSRVADKMCQDGITDSAKYLAVFLDKVQAKNYSINNIAISVEAGQPRLEHLTEKIAKNIADLCSLDVDQVGLAFTSGDHLSAYADGKGIACRVAVSLVKNDD